MEGSRHRALEAKAIRSNHLWFGLFLTWLSWIFIGKFISSVLIIVEFAPTAAFYGYIYGYWILVALTVLAAVVSVMYGVVSMISRRTSDDKSDSIRGSIAAVASSSLLLVAAGLYFFVALGYPSPWN